MYNKFGDIMKDELLLKQYEALMQGVDKEISILSNTSAFIMDMMEDVSWAGFYLYDEKLYLGPFQGKVACTLIPMNQGVCGTSAYKRETIIVENVHEFAGHIACDSASNSEIVIPIVIDDELYGVLDLDSTSYNRFNEDDKEFLEGLVSILIKHLKSN